MTYARKMAEKCADSPHLPPTVADITHIESVINEVIEACAREADKCSSGNSAAFYVRALAAAPATQAPGPVTPDGPGATRGPAETGRPACASWCGDNNASGAVPCFHRAGVNILGKCYCTSACRDAGRPLNPPPQPIAASRETAREQLARLGFAATSPETQKRNQNEALDNFASTASPACGTCNGLGVKPMKGADGLASCLAGDCPDCHGTGRTAAPGGAR